MHRAFGLIMILMNNYLSLTEINFIAMVHINTIFQELKNILKLKCNVLQAYFGPSTSY